MRAVFVGASAITVMAVKEMTEAGHEVVIIDTTKDRIDELEEELDCGFVNADGSRPSVLRELGAEDTDVLFCFSDDDQDNIIAALVGKSLGFERVVTKMEDPDFESSCVELGSEDPIIPSRETANKLCDLLDGREVSGIATALEGGLRFFSFVATDDDEGLVSDLELPEGARVVAIVRDGKSELAHSELEIREGDEVVLVAKKSAGLAPRAVRTREIAEIVPGPSRYGSHGFSGGCACDVVRLRVFIIGSSPGSHRQPGNYGQMVRSDARER